MAEYSKYNIVYRLQKWMDSVPGQTFLNYGTLFKLTHLPGANIMLFIGMGTEVFVFFISAFDRPFDKTDDGKKIPTRVTEEYLETGKVTYNNIHEDDAEDEGDEQFMTSAPADNSSVNVQQPDFGASMSPAASGTASGGSYESADPTSGMESPVGGMNPNLSESTSTAGQSSAEQALAAAIKQQTEVIASSQTATPEMVDAQEKYVDALKNLTELLGKVGEHLTRDSEEMENLNRTLTGISKVYELQLKGASKQVGTIDQINDQTRKMAEQIAKLNEIYTRMIESMTVNMQNKNQ